MADENRPTVDDIIQLRKEKADPTTLESTKYVGLEHIKSGGGLLGIGDSSEIKSLKSVFKKGDVLYGKLRPYLNKHMLAPFDGICSTDILVFHSPDTNTAKLFNYYLGSRDFINQAHAESKGVNLPRISAKSILKFPLDFPEKPEQERLVALLDQFTSRQEKIEGALSRLPGLLRDFRESVLRKAVTGALTEEWSSTIRLESVNDLLKRVVAPPKPNRFKSRSTSITPGRFAVSVGKPDKEIPERYKWVPLYRIAHMASGHTPSRKHPEYWGGEVNWIGIRDAGTNHGKTIYKTEQRTNELGLENSASVLLPANTVCFSRTASVGYVVKMGVPMATSQDFVNWVCTEAIDPDWLKWLLIAEVDSMKGFGKGSTHTTIYYPELLSLHVALPPLEEQREIVKRVEKLLAFADRIQKRMEKLKKQVDDLPQAVLGRAFRGEL